MLDGDSEGRKQQERYRDIFGPILDDRTLILPDLCGDQKIKETEDLLSPAVRERITEAVFAAGEPRPRAKKALHHALLELYARREAVALDSKTTERITALLDELSRRLKQ